MDAATAEMVDGTMAEAFRDATVITVAHRLASVMKICDRVAVMSEGRVVERGRPRCEGACWFFVFFCFCLGQGGREKVRWHFFLCWFE